MQLDKDLQSVQEVRDLIKTAKEAQRALARMDQGQIDKIVAAISAAGAEHAGRLAAMAVEETGFGKKEDKELKNRFAALTLYEAIRNERTIGILAEDKEKRIIDIGVPEDYDKAQSMFEGAGDSHRLAMFDRDGTVNISARSMGAVNVQIIMEYLGGGGHLNMAACQLEIQSFENAKQMLLEAIDRYEEGLSRKNNGKA